MKILVIDGQGGRMGKTLVEQLIVALPGHEILAIGTNSVATAAMNRAGAAACATGENPVVVNAPLSDVIVGPVGIILPNSLLGEITPAMAYAVGASGALKVLLPINKCNCHIVGTPELPLGEYVRQAITKIAELAGA